MKITSEDLDIIKALEEYEPGKWLEGRDLKYLDLSNNHISIKGDAASLINEDPELILRTIRLSGEIIMDIDEGTFKILKEKSNLLDKVPRNRLRNHFIGILTSNDAEKALAYARDAKTLIFMFGDSVYRTMSKRTRDDLNILINNINKARPEMEHRLTLLLYPLGKDKAIQVLNYLIIDKDTGTQIVQAIKTVDKLYFLNTKMELKRFIKKYGYDNYVFIDKIARQLKKIYDRMDYKVESRHYMLEEAKTYQEALHIEDLDITAQELIDNGYSKDDEEAQAMLNMLLDLVITKPRLNTKKQLFKKATHLKINPIYRKTTKVWWRR